jgi:hypothetical protein
MSLQATRRRYDGIHNALKDFTSRQLTTNQVVDIADLEKAAPDLVSTTGNPGPSSAIYLSIRGEA